jgi:hypothetical protein
MPATHPARATNTTAPISATVTTSMPTKFWGCASLVWSCRAYRQRESSFIEAALDGGPRAHRRRWQQATSARFAKAIRLCNSKAIHVAASNFAHRGSIKGRQRALTVLRTAFDPLGTVESLEVTGPHPRIFYSIVSATLTDLFVKLPDSRELTEDEEQEAVSVNYLCFGRLGGHVHIRGVWGLSASAHALGRFFDRGGEPAALTTALLDAHRALLVMPARNLEKLLAQSLLLPCGNGFWWCTPAAHRSRESGAAILHVRARTWINTDLVSDQQSADSDALRRREPDEPLLVGSPLHPLGLRALAAQGSGTGAFHNASAAPLAPHRAGYAARRDGN